MKRFVVAAAVVLLAGAAEAQTPASPPAAVTPQPGPQRLELARQLVEVMRLRATMEIMMKDLIPVLREQQKSQLANLSPEQRRLMFEATDETIAFLIDRAIDEYTPIYAAEFTEEEMRAVIAFYSSPVGQTLLDKTPKLSAASADVMRKLMPEIQGDLLRRFCSKVDCLKLETPEPDTTPS